jgi:hypothetical protein
MHSQRLSTRHPLQVSFPVRLLHAAFVGISVLIPLGMLTLATAWLTDDSTGAPRHGDQASDPTGHTRSVSVLSPEQQQQNRTEQDWAARESFAEPAGTGETSYAEEPFLPGLRPSSLTDRYFTSRLAPLPYISASSCHARLEALHSAAGLYARSFVGSVQEYIHLIGRAGLLSLH